MSSTNAVEHMALPYDAASRRLFGVPIVATVSEAAGVGHVLAVDAVVLDTDTMGVGVQWSETSNTDDFSKNLIRARLGSIQWAARGPAPESAHLGLRGYGFVQRHQAAAGPLTGRRR